MCEVDPYRPHGSIRLHSPCCLCPGRDALGTGCPCGSWRGPRRPCRPEAALCLEEHLGRATPANFAAEVDGRGGARDAGPQARSFIEGAGRNSPWGLGRGRHLWLLPTAREHDRQLDQLPAVSKNPKTRSFLSSDTTSRLCQRRPAKRAWTTSLSMAEPWQRPCRLRRKIWLP